MVINIVILSKKSIQLFEVGFDYSDIEMEGFHFLKNEFIIIQLTQNIYLPRHHFKEHD